MYALVAVLLTSIPGAAPPPAVEERFPYEVESLFARVAPAGDKPGRSRGQTRAVVLLHGLNLFTGRQERIGKLTLRAWQEPGSLLVKELASHADVYSLAYTQTAPVERIYEGAKLRDRVRELKKEGYKEIVLVGHSAGGLVARHFVEDYPESGVTKVVQVCAPNAGSSLAGFKFGREASPTFLSSMSRTSRLAILKKRKEVYLPDKVEFACVVGSLRLGGDGIVSYSSQWSEDLQKQNVPAYLIRSAHWDVVKTEKGAEAIAEVVREAQPRWTDEQVKKAKPRILGS